MGRDELPGLPALTHIVRRITRSGQRVVAGGFLGKAKIREFQDGIGPFGGVQEILRLQGERDRQTAILLSLGGAMRIRR